MSRIGKKPIEIPKGVTVAINGQEVAVKGPKGELKLTLVEDVTVEQGADGISVKPRDDTQRARAMWGLSRTLVQNLVIGVTDGFTTNLEINGVGYRAALQGKNIQLSLGFSHDVIYPIPEGIEVKIAKPTEISISGTDKQKVGQVAAEIRGYRGPEPYKGKGVKYAGEFIFRKEGKKK
ncbi:50S ribosomal protein L6 [Parvibaculum sedimenti]|uniref:Large ribosomal subunit protein uL6 n=1 Tax=Parvibaculum sedimenti TaxID=2608632 RepID=A0A6N6VLH9_9HYPH|nr:50S ribosomal protein L6 [Parvibaculum sedimenti]KAB7740258.1 50S ribosomal protein L6 [Parvibaculum sedimenti]